MKVGPSAPSSFVKRSAGVPRASLSDALMKPSCDAKGVAEDRLALSVAHGLGGGYAIPPEHARKVQWRPHAD
jgi:hypothetical protein